MLPLFLCILVLLEHALDAPVRRQPHHGDQHIEGLRKPMHAKRHNDRRPIEHQRDLALPVVR
jgi:hypothetical protein